MLAGGAGHDRGVKGGSLMAAGVVVVAVVAACSGDSTTSDPLDTSTSEPSETSAAADSTPPPDSTTPVTADAPTTTTTTTGGVEEPVSPECDPTAALGYVNRVLKRARLAPGGEWTEASDQAAFVARTNTAAEYAHRVGGFDCSARLAQVTSEGDERLLLVAWVGDRVMYTLQATDAPSRPYDTAINFQLMVETADGEMLREGFEWAGTMEDGESIVVGAVDGPVALAAKSWPSGVPRFEDIPVALEIEQYAIDLLNDAGAHNVSIGEPAGEEWPVAAVQHVTPLGLHLIATIAPPEWFSPDAALFPGTTTVESIEGVDVHLTVGEGDAYAVASVGWLCGDHVWYIDSLFGTPDELLDWAGVLIETGDCPA